MANIVNSSTRELPIGVFDSGLGGLTVVQEVKRRLPNEHIVYLGDNARVPYGTRSPQTIERYAWNCAEFLVKRGLKLLVVACNTASAVAIQSLRERTSVPVLGVIKAGATAAVAATKNRRVGIIGTAGTVGSGAYPRLIGKIDPDVAVFQNPAPLLVPLAEEGWLEGEVPALAVNRYVTPLIKNDIDVLMLGCTHYPILRSVIEAQLQRLGSSAAVVDSATSMTVSVKNALNQYGLGRISDAPGDLTCFVTDLPKSFQECATRFLGHSIDKVEKIDI